MQRANRNWCLAYIVRALQHSSYSLTSPLSGQQILEALEAYDLVEPVTQEQADAISEIVILGLEVKQRVN